MSPLPPPEIALCRCQSQEDVASCRRAGTPMCESLWDVCRQNAEMRSLWDSLQPDAHGYTPVGCGRPKPRWYVHWWRCIRSFFTVSQVTTIILHCSGCGGLLKQAQSFTIAYTKWVAAGMPTTPEEELQERRQQCNQCPQRTPEDTCNLCGCPLAKKLRMATETCPAQPPRWLALPTLNLPEIAKTTGG